MSNDSTSSKRTFGRGVLTSHLLFEAFVTARAAFVRHPVRSHLLTEAAPARLGIETQIAVMRDQPQVARGFHRSTTQIFLRLAPLVHVTEGKILTLLTIKTPPFVSMRP